MADPFPASSQPSHSWRDRLPAWIPPDRAPAGVGALIVAVAIAAVAWFGLGARPPEPELLLPRAVSSPPPPGEVAAESPDAPPTASMAVVHAAGAVAAPGVYTVPVGARVADVLTAAGGPRPEADLDQLNLATRVADGDRIYLPRRGEAAPVAGGPGHTATGGGAAGAGPAAPLDLNTASAEDLEGLPGVGPATAEAILEYRRAHGRFRSVTELLEVRGIGPAKLAALRPKVRV